MPVQYGPHFEWSKFYSGLAAVISTEPLEVWTRPFDGGLEFQGSVEGSQVAIRAVDAECPEGRGVPEYRLGFIYWLANELGVLRPGIVPPDTFAELTQHVVAYRPVSG
jgi:hypothetical protein